MNMTQLSEAMRRGDAISRKDQIHIMIMLSIPAIFEQLVMTMMNYIDTAMVGSLGHEATAAIGVMASSTWLVNGLVNAAAVGFSVQVAQYLGAGREKDSRNVLCQAIKFNILFGIILAVVVGCLGRYLPGWLGADGVIESLAKDYFCTLAMFLPLFLSSIMYSAFFRCSGNVIIPSIMNVGMCFMDVVFNFFLIYPSREINGILIWGAGLGVKGAALGTGLAQACSGLILLILITRRRGPLRLSGDESWSFTKICVKNAVRLGTPVALERTTLCLAQLVMTSVITSMGAVAIAANYVAVQTESICYLPAYGVAAAATALVGQSIGAGRADMAKKFAYGTTALGFGLITVTGTIMFIGAPFLTGILTQDMEVMRLSVIILKIVVLSEPLFAVSIIVIGALRGAGDSKGPFIVNLISMWGFRVIPVLLFAKNFGLVGAWVVMTIELIIRGLIFLVRLIRSNWGNVTALN